MTNMLSHTLFGEYLVLTFVRHVFFALSNIETDYSMVQIFVTLLIDGTTLTISFLQQKHYNVCK